MTDPRDITVADELKLVGQQWRIRVFQARQCRDDFGRDGLGEFSAARRPFAPLVWAIKNSLTNPRTFHPGRVL